MKKRTKKDMLLDVVKEMPPLYHTLPGEDFSWEKSEVVRWLLEQPEILNFIWQSIYNRTGASSRLVAFDPETKKWQGVDYHGD